MKSIGTAILILTLLTPVLAEDEVDKGAILAQLASEQPSEMAWGAYRAGKGGVTEAIPKLAELLLANPARDSAEVNLMKAAVLDALIQLRAKVPGDVATDVVRMNATNKCWGAALILLSGNPKANRHALLRLFHISRRDYLGNPTVAMGNLLCQVRAEGFAATLLPELNIHLEITVRDPDNSIGGGAGGPFGGRGDGVLRQPEGFPPFARYLFWAGRPHGAKLLADGPRPIYYTREEVKGSGLLTGIDGANHPARKCAFEWTAAMLDAATADLEFDRKVSRLIYWAGPDDYLAKATAAHEQAIGTWTSLRDRCLTAKLLTTAEAATMEPPVTVTIKDARKDQSVSLPELPPLKTSSAETGASLAQLTSGVPAEAAWGAYRAGRRGLTAAIPLLAEVLKPTPSPDSKETDYLKAAVLDALIRLDAKVPGDIEGEVVLHNAKGMCWRPALILLSRNPEKNQAALLKLFGAPSGDHISNATLAMGNLLCEARADGFAARLLGHLGVKLQITARDPDPSFSGWGGTRNLSASSGDGYLRLPEGFPPCARYLFWDKKADGSVLLADGTRPVWYTRREMDRSGLMTGVDGAKHDRRDCTFEWLGLLLHVEPAEINFKGQARARIDWVGEAEYLEQAVQKRKQAIAQWLDLRDWCVKEKLMAADEAAAIEVPLAVEIRDKRKDQSVALPNLPPFKDE